MKLFVLTVACAVSVAACAWAQDSAPATTKAAAEPAVAVVSGSVDTVIVAVAGSELADPKAAAIDATAAVIIACGGQAKGLIVIEDSKDPAAVVAGVMEAGKGLPMIGTHGEAMVSDRSLKAGGVAVMAIGGKKASVATAVAPLDKQRKNTAAALVKQLKDQKDVKVVFALSEPDLSFEPGVTVEDFLFGMQEGFGKDVMLFGGNCKPINRNDGGIQFKDGKTFNKNVVAMTVSGPIKYYGDHTTEFKPVGAPAKATKVDGKWILELDGKPAAQVYRERRGMKPDEKFTADSEHPIGVVVAPDRRYNRMILEWKDAEGNMTGRPDSDQQVKTAEVKPGTETALRFITAIPEGSLIQVMDYPGTSEAINESAKLAVEDMLKRAGKATPLVILSSDCCARGSRLKKFSKNEGKDADEVKNGIVPVTKGKIPFFGFYAYGEIGPIRGPFLGLNYEYQQHTFVGLTLVIDEAAKEAPTTKPAGI